MKCKSKKSDGNPCQAQALNGSNFCNVHDPASGARMAAARKKGGQRVRVGHAGDTSTLPANIRTLDDVLSVLDYALAEAIEHENSIQRGRLLVAICGAFVEAIKTGELEKQIAMIQIALKQREATE